MKEKADPSLDIVATDLTSAIGRLLRRLRGLRTQANPNALALSQMGALARLEQSGSMTTADLARAELMKPQSMGVILASLEQEGLIARRPHPTDRRQILFTLTETGTAARTRHRSAKRDWLVGALAELDPAALKTLTDAIQVIRRIGES
ncbi:MarR family winged helix-turn-helix transcriptional regulator [Caulobacter sp. KR2-114]|uniref:MarR family winged helix-turn-helix transcriptional regulator n=1 Tax=Caulobacter sp. KR2-114 TaxID=3400912 RepID=UPI003C09A2D1